MIRLLALSLALATGVVAGTNSVPATPAHQRIAAGALTAPRGRTCGLKSPLKVSVRALSTPLVGRELVLEVTVANGKPDGAVHSWLRLPDGLDAADASSWIDDMTQGQMLRHRVTVRVNSGAPLAITAKASSVGGPSEPPGEGYLTLYPLEITPAGVRAKWSATTLRSLDDPAPRVIQLKTGDRAEIISGN